jgi:hypothetical protein
MMMLVGNADAGTASQDKFTRLVARDLLVAHGSMVK